MRVEKLRQAFEIEIATTHFPLHPDTPEEGMSLAELFAGRDIDLDASYNNMQRLMAAEALPYAQRTMTYNSRLAQELGKWADTQPGGENIHEALFKAYFVEHINIGETDKLLTIAEQVGLPTDEAARVLAERSFRDAIDADWQRSMDLGVTGVPTFVIGNQGLVGAQPYEQLEEFLESQGVERRES